MTALVKLTDRDCRTFRGTLWGEGVTHSGTGRGPLCGPGWIHAYAAETLDDAALLAVLFNPIHAAFDDPIGWSSEGEIALDDATKVGCRALTTIRRIGLPAVSNTQRVRWAILCARKVVRSRAWLRWADGWLSGRDRSAEAARAAVAAGERHPHTAWETHAAWWAASAALSCVVETAQGVVTGWVQEEAASAAKMAHDARPDLDLIALARQAIAEEPAR